MLFWNHGLVNYVLVQCLCEMGEIKNFGIELFALVRRRILILCDVSYTNINDQ